MKTIFEPQDLIDSAGDQFLAIRWVTGDFIMLMGNRSEIAQWAQKLEPEELKAVRILQVSQVEKLEENRTISFVLAEPPVEKAPDN